MSSQELRVAAEKDDDEVFFNYEIASYPSDLTLKGILDLWEEGDIIIPEYQRNFVWSQKQASLLIESFLLGLPVPQVFLYVNDDNKFEVIDGQQRITSVVYFLQGYFGDESLHGKKQVFRLKGLSERSPYANLTFEDLAESDQRKLKQTVLRAINIKQLRPTDENTCVYHIFERLNTGGTPLKPQEIRNCVFRGPIVSELRELNANESWRKIVGKKTLDIYQKDIELLLRVFSLTEDWNNYTKPMKEFLNSAMAKNVEAKSKKFKRFVAAFPEICELIIDQLGDKPFHIRGPLNASVLDSVLCTVIQHKDSLRKNLKDQFDKLMLDEQYQHSTYYGTSDESVLKIRFELAQTYLTK